VFVTDKLTYFASEKENCLRLWELVTI